LNAGVTSTGGGLRSCSIDDFDADLLRTNLASSATQVIPFSARSIIEGCRFGCIGSAVGESMSTRKSSARTKTVAATSASASFPPTVGVVSPPNPISISDPFQIWKGKVEPFLSQLRDKRVGPIFDLIVTSPPYNIGKDYEKKMPLDVYLSWQRKVIHDIVPFLKDSGSLCWQVGNYVEDGAISPIDIEVAPFFRKEGLRLRNRIVWHFGHGMHSRRRLSGRYEVAMWYTKTDEYVFNLDAIRVPSKYAGKKHFRGPNKGEYSGNILGKNPEDVWAHPDDVWDIPNVKSNHVEKTEHPCQFPVGLVERLVLGLTNEHGLVFDPFAGVCSAGVAAAIHNRHFWGCEPVERFVKIGKVRLESALVGKARYRPHDKPIMDPSLSPVSRRV
jgi:adenine-specific DNA-methyltransferase